MRLGLGRTPAERAATLSELARQKGLLFGAAVRPELLTSDAAYADLVASQCSILVPEGVLKWQALRPTPDTFDFSQSNAYVAFGQKHHQKIRGHALVWHLARPPWFDKVINQDNAREYLVKHIRTVAGYYAGTIESWDVVNEAILLEDGRKDHLRNTPWLQFIGPEYLDIAYRTTAAADPGARLVYNDYGLEDDGENAPPKRVAVLELLRGFKKRGVPVHGFGLQSHLTGRLDWQPTSGLREFVREVAALGFAIYITELDVNDAKLPADIAARDRAVAAVYKTYLQTVLEEPAVKAVLCWGITDRNTWLNHQNKRADGLPQRPLPFDDSMQPTPVFEAIAEALRTAPARTARVHRHRSH